MRSKRKKAIKNLAADIDSITKEPERSNAIQSLVDCCINIQNENKRQKVISDIVSKSDSVRKLLDENPELVRSEVEQALLRLATGHTVKERRERISNGHRTVEVVTKEISPSQAAVEFFLTNKASDNYSKNPVAKSDDGSGIVAEIMEAIRNVK